MGVRIPPLVPTSPNGEWTMAALEIERVFGIAGPDIDFRIIHMDESLRSSRQSHLLGSWGGWSFRSNNYPEAKPMETTLYLRGFHLFRDRDILSVPRNAFEGMVAAIAEFNAYHEDRQSLYDELFDRMENDA